MNNKVRDGRGKALLAPEAGSRGLRNTDFSMNAPQILMIILLALGLGISAAKHGASRSDYNFWTDLIATGILVALLRWGGFWS